MRIGLDTSLSRSFLRAIRRQFVLRYAVVAMLAVVSLQCRTTTVVDIGGDFFVKTRTYTDFSHEYSERDLYRKSFIALSTLIERDIGGAAVSPNDSAVLYVARKRVADGIEGTLKLYLQPSGRTIFIDDGMFFLEPDWWSPSGSRFVYKKSGQPIVVFELDGESKHFPIRVDGQKFLSWSPSGQMIAHSTGGSIYEENHLYAADVKTHESIAVAIKKGRWRKTDFSWVREGDSEVIRITVPRQ